MTETTADLTSTHHGPSILRSTSLAFNTNAIVYDNTPWRPGRDTDHRSGEDERKLNLATRIMSNGVEVLVKDKNDGKQEQRMLKLTPISSTKVHNVNSIRNRSLLSSAVATVVSRQQTSAILPMHHLMRHNYIIKTCMTTYTYLTTIVHNKRSAISTFETIVSVVTTESLTNLYASEVLAELKPTKTKYMDVKTIQATATNGMYLGNFPKIDKKIDSHEDDTMFDLIQPSEVSHVPCTTTSCSCSHTKTEPLQSKYTNAKDSVSGTEKHSTKTTKRDNPKLDIKTTNRETLNMNTKYRPYDYEINSKITPTDRIVEKYTEVISDYSDEKQTNPLDASDLLTNEQAPAPTKTNKVSNNTSEKVKPEKHQKINKNKLVVAELIKLGSLGIKGLSQLTPIFEKMTGSFMKRQDGNLSSTTTTTAKPVTKITPYAADKRVDSAENKPGNFPIYIPVDEMETSESQVSYSNISMHPNFPWALEYKHSKSHILPPKIVQESPLVNGGIPISPGEIIRANSDVIVGKPAVGGPLTLAASGIKLHNSVNRPPLDSFMADSEQYPANEPYPLQLPQSKKPSIKNVDDSFDLRPPEPPKISPPSRSPSLSGHGHQSLPSNINYDTPYYSMQGIATGPNDRINHYQKLQSNTVIKDHGKTTYLDYIPSLTKPTNSLPLKQHIEYRPFDDKQLMDSSPSSSEIVNTKVDTTDEDSSLSDSSESLDKPFLVDIQPSRVANVLIPHGSSTALIFAGSSEPHKTGEYIDDPLPYPEPGYFGSFSIDAPQMTNVHSVNPNKNQFLKDSRVAPLQGISNNRFNENKNLSRNETPIRKNQRYNIHNIPPPMSIQETHLRVGPHITVYNPDNYKGDFEKYKQNKKSKDEKQIIDLEYENYLAVPPPPRKQHFNQEKPFIENKPYNQRPIVHTKPVHDMKVFLNVQHPVPDQLPPKITSEVYFASQIPSNGQSTNKFQVSKSQSTNNPKYNKLITSSNHVQQSNSFSIISSPNIANKSIITNIGSDNTYSVTFNTGTGIQHADTNAHMVGSSITVPISTSDDNGLINANIPIGTNFAIRVEDDPSKYDTVALHGKPDPSLTLQNIKPIQNNINKAQNSVSIPISNSFEDNNKDVIVSMPPSQNSHANFPMITEHTYELFKNRDSLSESVEDNRSTEQKQPGKIISNPPTNSHGWYSSILNEDKIKNMYNIKMDVSTAKVIPLSYDYKDTKPGISKKITNIVKPPADFLEGTSRPGDNKFNIGKPFSKQKESDKPVSTFTIKPSYIPSVYTKEQVVYNIPITDNSNDDKTKTSHAYQKPIYETAEEIYDGKDDSDTEQVDGEISSESMKVPIVTSSKENGNNNNFKSTSIKPLTLNDKVKVNNFNIGTQTEKPFGSHNKTTFQSNSMSPIVSHPNPYMKPRPFTISSSIPLDHQLQQPHWHINQMMENNTDVSYEDSSELNTREKYKPISRNKTSDTFIEELHNRQVFNLQVDGGHENISNIITSTVHISDKKPLIVKGPERPSTLTTFTTDSNSILNHTNEENIINLSPPPPNVNYGRPQQNKDLIMGMTPPLPDSTLLSKHQLRPLQTSRPSIPMRTPPPYRNLPPRTLPPRVSTQRPIRKPVQNDEVSTYRPSDAGNKFKRPYYNRYQPSSLLVPPPKELPTRIQDLKSTPELPLITASGSGLVFSTATISSSWITSSGVDFSSRFNFAPSAVPFPEIITSPTPSLPDANSGETSVEDSYSYEDTYTQSKEDNLDKKDKKNEDQFNEETSALKPVVTNRTNMFKVSSQESSQENLNDKVKIIPIGNKNRTRKPYPVRPEDRKENQYKPSSKSSIINPTKTFSRPEILYPTRNVINKIIHPSINRFPTTRPVDIIESSETSLEEDFTKPTQVLSTIYLGTPTIAPESTSVIEKTVTSTVNSNRNDDHVNTHILHHAGNEIKISDEIVPIKTEFKTTVVTFTKTLTEPPETISSVGYVNLTHTMTVTHTKTSLISKSEGAVTQTLVLTNTHTSTVVDVITEIYTQVQPTTIIETVTKHIPIAQVEATPVQEITATKVPLDDISMSSEENDNFIIKDSIDGVTENIQKIEAEEEKDSDSFFIVMNKSQNGGKSPPIKTDIETGDYDGITRNEQVNNNGVSQVLFGEILLAGTPYLETTNIGHPAGIGFGKECQPDCKASRNERCQRIDGIMKCVCRPGFARMFPDRPCKPTYTYSVRLVLESQGKQRLRFHPNLADNSTKEYHQLAMATHEGINRMVMQSDLRDVFHGVHITGFQPVEMRGNNGMYRGVTNDFYVQLSDNAHEYRLKEVIEKYLRNNNYSLGGTEVHAAADHIDRLTVSDFDECISGQFHDCSEHAKCFNLRGTYTCSCLEGFADLSVNTFYPGRICSSEAVGCDTCNYHGTCFDRDSAVICECFKWYAGRTCQVNLKAVLITVTVSGLLIITAVTIFASRRCCAARSPATQTFVIGCMQGMPSLHQGNMPKQRADRRALIAERENAETCSVQNASLPYVPTKRGRSSSGQKCVMSEPPAHSPPPPPAPAVLIPRARLHQHSDSRDNLSRKKSLEACAEAKLISYLESGATNITEEMRRKHSLESSYSANKDRHNKQGALVSAGFKVSTTVRPEDGLKEDDASSINKTDIDGQISSQEDNMSEWTDAERRLGELTLSEARSVGGTLPASTGRAASSTRLTHQEAHTMAERDLGSTFLLPHVHLYKPDPNSDVSEFDSL